MSLTKDAIQVFLAVLDKGSFSAAARSIGRVPSAVSMTIANLEADLNLELFDRRGREPLPTTAARALEAKARFMLQQFELWEAQALGRTAGPAGAALPLTASGSTRRTGRRCHPPAA